MKSFVLLVTAVFSLLLSCQNPASDPVPGAVTGRITILGVGVSGVTVSAGGESTVTDASGGYRLSAAAGTTVRVVPSKDHYQFAPSEATVRSGGLGDFDSQPAIFVPTSYTQAIPAVTDPVLVSAEPLASSFSPTVLGARMNFNHAGNVFWINPFSSPSDYLVNSIYFDPNPYDGFGVFYKPAFRSELLNASGDQVAVPLATVSQWQGNMKGDTNYVEGPKAVASTAVKMLPLAQVPRAEVTAYWRVIPNSDGTLAVRTLAGRSGTGTYTYTQGVEDVRFSALTATLRSEVSAGVGPVKASISFQLTKEAATKFTSYTSSQSTTTQSFVASDRNRVVVQWQLVYEVRFVRPATPEEVAAGKDPFGNVPDAFGFVPFSDPNYTIPAAPAGLGPTAVTNGFLDTDLGPFDYCTPGALVPWETFFAAPN